MDSVIMYSDVKWHRDHAELLDCLLRVKAYLMSGGTCNVTLQVAKAYEIHLAWLWVQVHLNTMRDCITVSYNRDSPHYNVTRECESQPSVHAPFTLKQLQSENAVWSLKNFGTQPYWHPMLGVVEEVGELSHSLLKLEQGIRGDHAKHEEEAMDAVGDIVVYLANLCNIRGWNFQAIVTNVWAEVKKRNWVENKDDGHVD